MRASTSSATRLSGTSTKLAVFVRILAAIFGGYALSSLGAQLLALGLAQLGMLRGEAVVLSAMLAFVLYLVILLWAFAARSLWRIVLVLVLCPLVLYFLTGYLL